VYNGNGICDLVLYFLHLTNQLESTAQGDITARVDDEVEYAHYGQDDDETYYVRE